MVSKTTTWTTALGTLSAAFEVDVNTGPTAGAAPLGSADFGVPYGAVIVAPGGLRAAVSAAPANAVLVLRGGTYTEQVNIGKPLTIQNYPGEVVWVDGKNTLQWAFIFKAKITMRGIGVRNYKILDENTFERGVMLPDGCDGSVLDQCWFTDFGDTAVQVFQNTGITISNCTFMRSGTNHIGSDRTTNLIVRNYYMKDANLQLRTMQPTTSAQKHTRCQGTIIRDGIIDGAPKVGGIWFDWGCYNVQIINNTITGCEYEQIQVEAGGKFIVAYNRCVGPSTYNIRLYDSNDCRVYNNTTSGGRNGHINSIQDERRASTSDPNYSNGVKWVSARNEFVNNQCDGNYVYCQLGVYDDRAVLRGEEMVTKIAGNVFAPKVSGTANTVLWSTGTPVARKDYNIDQLQTMFPGIVSTRTQAAPADIAALYAAPPTLR